MIKSIPVRFFIYDPDQDSGEGDFIECREGEFLAAEGTIEYEYHTVFDKGANQICLTKNPFYNC